MNARMVPFAGLHRANVAEVNDPVRGCIAVLLLEDPHTSAEGVFAIVQPIGTYTPFRYTCPVDATARLIPRTAVAS